MIDEPPEALPETPSARRGTAVPWVILSLVLLLAGWLGWKWWHDRELQAREQSAAADRIVALEARIDALRREQRSQAQRLQQGDATNRVLRDELLGIGQRAALLEDSVSRLADPERHGAQALRLDEVELVLASAQQRLQLAGDLEGAKRAYALAGGLLASIDDPAYLNLRQTLTQERAALDALGADPQRVAAGRLDAFVAKLRALPEDAEPEPHRRAPWLRRLLASFLEVRPSDGAQLRAPAERAAGLDALHIELTLARAALERRDEAAWRAALERAERWLARLWPESAALRARRHDLQALRRLPLTLPLPVLGSTLEQLRSLRAAR